MFLTSAKSKQFVVDWDHGRERGEMKSLLGKKLCLHQKEN